MENVNFTVRLSMTPTLGQARSLLKRHDFDSLKLPNRTRVSLRRAQFSDLNEAEALTQRTLGHSRLASRSVVERILIRNANSVLLFKRGRVLLGLWAMLPLAPKGLEALLLGEFPFEDPNPDFLVTQTQPPAAIYVWAVVASGVAAEGIHHVSCFLRQPLYCLSNLYTRAATSNGARIIVETGFNLVQGSDLYRYVRAGNRSDSIN